MSSCKCCHDTGKVTLVLFGRETEADCHCVEREELRDDDAEAEREIARLDMCGLDAWGHER